MMPITLQQTPNQSVSFVADSQQYSVRVWFDGDDMMFMDVTLNGVLIASSYPCLIGEMVIPFAYLEGDGGNFFWTTGSGNNPNYANFGRGDVLLYASNAEMATSRATIATDAQQITRATNQAA